MRTVPQAAVARSIRSQQFIQISKERLHDEMLTISSLLDNLSNRHFSVTNIAKCASAYYQKQVTPFVASLETSVNEICCL